jgi:hypothetical protein
MGKGPESPYLRGHALKWLKVDKDKLERPVTDRADAPP